jgi:hypothetical protein
MNSTLHRRETRWRCCARCLTAARRSARDAAIVFSIAVQHGADPEVIRRALCRNSDGSASGSLGMALDLIAADRGDRL